MMNHKQFKHAEPEIVLEDLTTTESDSGRWYNSPIGSLPSVTTVTGWKKSKFFAKWRRENPQESRRVLSRGNKLHKIIEDYLNNKSVTEVADGNVMELFTQLKPELDKIDNIHALEVPLWSETMMMAGRVDCVAEYDGKLSIIDFKGSTRPKDKKDIDNYFLQATAYAVAWQERTGQRIDNFAILLTSEEGITQVFQGNPVNYVKGLLKAIEGYHKSMEAV
jgi:genome maintenance exonuclease 1